MQLDSATAWASAHPLPATIAASTLLVIAAVAGWSTVRAVRAAQRPPAAVLVAALAAAACTAYSADTSWRFAAHELDMVNTTERAAMFAAGELALLACALMARQNLRTSGAPGVPGGLVWVITGVQIVPAFAESGLVGGIVRAFFGPVCSALLWHLAMGLELRHARPGAHSGSLLAVLARELRERLLSRLGLAARNRSAEQITRDRATATVVRLASRRRLGPWGTRRLAAAVTRSGAALDGEQRHRLTRELAARRGANTLRTVDLPSVWEPEPAPVQPRTPAALTHQELTRMDPLAAVRRVRAAHPGLHPAALASLCTEYGVVVTETQVRIAIGAGNPSTPRRTPAVPARPVPVLAPVPEAPAAEPSGGLVLDLALAREVPSDARTRVPVPVLAAGQQRRAVHARVPTETPGTHGPGTDEDLLPAARALSADGHLPTYAVLKRELRIGQARAERIRAVLATEVRPVPDVPARES